jgi:hypothetical protein
MKDLSIIQKTAFCQNRKNIRDALTCVSPIFNPIKPKIGTLNIFLIQNKGKGPPGRSRRPGTAHFPLPDHKPAAGNSSNKSCQIFKVQYFKFFNN